MTRESVRRRERRAGGIAQVPWRRLQSPFAPLAILREEQVEAVHGASLQILEELGLEFQSEEALAILRGAGADVDPAAGMVRFDRALIGEMVAKAPASFTLHARNPERRVDIGGRSIAFATVSGPPNVSDMDRGRRPGTLAAQQDLIRLEQSLAVLHMAGSAPVDALDLPAESRHLDLYFNFLTLTDRIFSARGIGRARCADAIDMLAIARGIDRERLKAEPGLLTVVNVNSPRRVDREMLAGLMEMARSGQATIVTPFTLAGAMSPVTIAGSLAQQNAEALAVIAFSQMVAPGSPVVYGGFTSNVDMRSGAPAFGTPEYVRATIAGGQLARRYRLPYRSSNVNAANAVDAQAAYESQMSIWAAVMGGANILHHGAGWLEGGLTASFEKMVLDAEMLQMMAEILQPLEVDAGSLALDAQREVPAGGHFFGAAHTLARYEAAFYRPLISDWRNFPAWQEAGSPTAADHAHRIWKALLERYEPPPMEEGVREQLEDFVARRKEQIGRDGL